MAARTQLARCGQALLVACAVLALLQLSCAQGAEPSETTARGSRMPGRTGSSTSSSSASAVSILDVVCLAQEQSVPPGVLPALQAGVTYRLAAGNYTIPNNASLVVNSTGGVVCVIGVGSSRNLSITPTKIFASASNTAVRHFEVEAGATLALQGLDLFGGAVDAGGGNGGVNVRNGAFVAADVVFEGITETETNGGALRAVDSSVTLRATAFSFNRVVKGSEAARGGAGFINGGTARFTGTRFVFNSAVSSPGSTSAAKGGALWATGGARVFLTDVTFDSNSASAPTAANAVGGALAARNATIEVAGRLCVTFNSPSGFHLEDLATTVDFRPPSDAQNFGRNGPGGGADIVTEASSSVFTCDARSPRTGPSSGPPTTWALEGPVCAQACVATPSACTCPAGPAAFQDQPSRTFDELATCGCNPDCIGPPQPAPANGTWNCSSGTANGANCTGTCAAGFQGSPVAACSLGAYSILNSTCAPRGCVGPPQPAPANGTWNCSSGTANGANCTGTCNEGFVGSPVAACSQDNYTITGSCTPRPPPPPPPRLSETLPVRSLATANHSQSGPPNRQRPAWLAADMRYNLETFGRTCALATGASEPAWLIIDLGESIPAIAGVRITSNASRPLLGWEVLIGDAKQPGLAPTSPQNLTLQLCATNATAQPLPAQANIVCGSTLGGRFVVVRLNTSGSDLVVCELQALATGCSGSPPDVAGATWRCAVGGTPRLGACVATCDNTASLGMPVATCLANATWGPVSGACGAPWTASGLNATTPVRAAQLGVYNQSRHGPPAVAARAIDGNTSGNWIDYTCASTSWARNPWLVLDLGSAMAVSGVVIHNRLDAVWDRLQNWRIEVGNSTATTMPTAAQVRPKQLCAADPSGGTAPLQDVPVLRVACGSPVVGRFVVISLPERVTFLTVCEVQAIVPA